MTRLAVLSACLLALSCACSDGGLDPVQTATLEVDPPGFAFGALAAGDAADRAVLIRNIGAGTLRLASLRATLSAGVTVYWQTHDDPRQYVGVDAEGAHYFPDVIDVPPGAALTLVASFVPAEDGQVPLGSVRFVSNDADRPRAEIPIMGAVARPEIRVAPGTVDMGRVPVGEHAEARVEVVNVGVGPLKVAAPRVNGSDGFAASMTDERPLAAGQTAIVTVRYAARRDGPAVAQLVIESNDANAPVTIVDLVANGASPCVSLHPQSVEFPAVLVGRASTRPLWVESCGGLPLTVSPTLVDGDDAFELVDARDLALPAYDPAGGPVQEALQVRFAAPSEGVHRGTLLLETNDPANPTVEVPILARAVHNACPIPQVGDGMLAVNVLDLVRLDGAMSSDPDGPTGRPVRYHWAILEQPREANVELYESPAVPNDPNLGGPPDDESTPHAYFWATIVGRYVFELRVTDALGVTAPSDVCDAGDPLVVVDAIANGDIHVQLTWDTPGDGDQTDELGTDLDLHVRHPDGVWHARPLDCYFANRNPDWGPAGLAGDPSLDIDDTNGAGPENTRIESPESRPEPYRIGVHYYRDANFGGGRSFGFSDATVRVFFGGRLAGEYTRRLDRTGDFWEVTDVFWSPDAPRSEALP